MDFESWLLTQWKANGAQGDYYQWEAQNKDALRAEWEKSTGGQAAATAGLGSAGGAEGDYYKAEYEKYIQGKYGASSDIVAANKTNPDGSRRVWKNGSAYLAHADSYAEWIKRAGANLKSEYDKQAADAQASSDTRGRITSFIDALGVENPNVRSLIDRQAQSAATRAVGQAGFGSMGGQSGLTQRGAAAMNADMTAKYALQRQAAQAQGLSLLSNYDLTQQQLKQQADQFAYNAQQAQNQSDWAAQKNQAQGTGAIVGGIIGAIPGIIAAPYTGGASLGLIGAGSAIGSAAGGLTSGGNGPAQSSIPAYSSGGRRSGGLGGTGY